MAGNSGVADRMRKGVGERLGAGTARPGRRPQLPYMPRGGGRTPRAAHLSTIDLPAPFW
jgi:hypothetical protein